MGSILDKEPGKRWPRAQRFQLSGKGVEAEESYQAMLAGARAAPGRQAFDAARAAWAAQLALEPSDGLYLGELISGPLSIDEMARALMECGTTKQEVHLAVDRLESAGMIDAVTPLPPAPRRW